MLGGDRMRHLLLPLVLAASFFTPVAANCPSFDTIATTLSTSERKGHYTPVNEVCLCSLLVREQRKSAETIPLIQAFSKRYPVSDTLLFCAYRHKALRENRSVFAALRHAWKQHNPSIGAILLNYQQNGASGKIDTLCTIFDQENALDVYLLLHWIEAKQVLDDYKSIPGLFCRVIQDRPGLAPLALNQFETIIDELPPALCDTLLVQFTRCNLSGVRADTAAIRSWIIDQYGRKQLFDRQLNLLFALEKNSAAQCEQLYTMAQQRLGRQHYAPAVAAARAAYLRTADTAMRQSTASLLYKAFRAQGLFDSAKVWLEQTGVTSEKSRIEAIDLYQHLGEYSKAAGLIALLAQSLARDTLHIRQLLLSDSLQAALQFVYNENTSLARSEPLRQLWRVRTTLFNGKTEACLALLDSIEINPSQASAAEYMDYRYWLLRCSNAPEALAKFIQIEYTLFKGDHGKAAQLLCSADLDSGYAWRIAVRIARKQIDRSDAAAAVATLRCAPAYNEPEYLFCLADADFRDGAFKTAREVLERLILEFPAGMYTSRGRLLLSRMP